MSTAAGSQPPAEGAPRTDADHRRARRGPVPMIVYGLVAALVVGAVTIPLVLIGPSVLERILPEPIHFLFYLYWPVVSLLTVASLTTLFHISTPQRSPWVRDAPGAALTLVIWILASWVVRGLSGRWSWRCRRRLPR